MSGLCACFFPLYHESPIFSAPGMPRQAVSPAPQPRNLGAGSASCAIRTGFLYAPLLHERSHHGGKPWRSSPEDPAVVFPQDMLPQLWCLTADEWHPGGADRPRGPVWEEAIAACSWNGSTRRNARIREIHLESGNPGLSFGWQTVALRSQRKPAFPAQWLPDVSPFGGCLNIE